MDPSEIHPSNQQHITHRNTQIQNTNNNSWHHKGYLSSKKQQTSLMKVISQITTSLISRRTTVIILSWYIKTLRYLLIMLRDATSI